MQRVTRRMSLRTCKRSITLKITVLSHCLEVGNINLNCLVVLVTLFTLPVHGMQEEKGNVLKWRTKGVITQYQCLFARRNSLQNNQLMAHDVWTTCTDSRMVACPKKVLCLNGRTILKAYIVFPLCFVYIDPIFRGQMKIRLSFFPIFYLFNTNDELYMLT